MNPTNPIQALNDMAKTHRITAEEISQEIRAVEMHIKENFPDRCPACMKQTPVEFTSTRLDSNRQAHSIGIGCTKCGISIKPQTWFESQPETAYAAIKALLDHWNTLPRQGDAQ